MNYVKHQWRRVDNLLRTLPEASQLLWQSAGRWTLAWAVVLVLLGALPIAFMRLIKSVVDGFAAATRSAYSWESLRPALIAAALLGIGILLTELLQGALEWLRAMLSERMQDRISSLVQQKATEVDLAFYETPQCVDQYSRARDEVLTRPPVLLDALGGLLQNGVSLVLLAWVIASYSGWLMLGMVGSFIPAFSIVAYYNWLTHKWFQQSTQERRWIQYYDLKFASAAAAPELRLFQLGDSFRAAYQALRDRLRGQRLKLIERQTWARMAAAGGGLIVAGGGVAWMGLRVVHGRGTLGDLALFYQAFSAGQNLFRVIAGSLGQLFSSMLHMGEFFRFLKLPARITDPPEPVPAPKIIKEGLRFENVSFHYPDSQRPALRNLSLHIPAGKIVAVVGPNGAGKSTLVKLICRFYDPLSGRITLDGIDLRDMSVADVRAMSSVLFQLPVAYDATAAKNIALCDADASDFAAIQAAARAAGADDVISALPNGYQAPLGKSFDEGHELSAGEWQRVAMARAFYYRRPLVLLDEPTSFMDPWAEADWFARLRDLARERTAVVVTHRFSIAMRADLIHVMERGRVVESGSHDELLELSGLYSRSWKDQLSAGQPASAFAMSTAIQ